MIPKRNDADGMSSLEHRSDEAYVIVKAAPRASKTHGETVCTAALTRDGDWVRLYPVSFRFLDDSKKFSRWQKIKYRWRAPKASQDQRQESRRVDHDSIEIVGALPARERNAFMQRFAINSLEEQARNGKSLALLKCEILNFVCERRSHEDLLKQETVYQNLRSQGDLFASSEVPRETCSHQFRYHFRDADGVHWGTCQDWETETTFLRRRSETNEAQALEWMRWKFGEDYPKRGMALAMGTHRLRDWQWLINGVIRTSEEDQFSLL